MSIKMKSTVRWLLWVFAGILGIVSLILVVASLVYSPEYVSRVLRWRDSDVYDYQKFPERAIEASPDTFHFKQDLDASRVVVNFEDHPIVGDLVPAYLDGLRSFIMLPAI